MGMDRRVGGARMWARRAAAGMLCVSVSLSAGCGNSAGTEEPTVAAAVSGVPAVAPVEQPKEFRAVLRGSTAAVSWAPASAGAALTGYNLYIDQANPVLLDAASTSFVTGSLKPGRDHLLQLVAVAGGEVSRPSTATITVSRAQKTRRTETMQAQSSNSRSPRPSTASTRKPQPQTSTSSRLVASTATKPETQAPTSTRPTGSQRPAVSGITVRGEIGAYIAVQQLGAGYDEAKPSCGDGWQPDLQVLDGAKAVLALAEYSTGKLSRVRHDNGFVSWSCDWTYTLIANESPVYTFHAEYENMETYRSDNRTLSRSSLSSGRGPSMYISLRI